MARVENYASKPHILVVDDDARIRDLVTRYLLENDFIVMAAADGADARRLLDVTSFDLAVFDVMMPGESGVDLVQALRDSGQGIPVLMLTALAEVQDRISGLEAGADDYLPKPFEPRELVLRINALLKRTMAVPTDDSVFDIGAVSFDPRAGHLMRRDGAVETLTETEVQLLKALLSKPGKVFTREFLSDVCGVSGGRAIDVQVTRLRRKLEEDSKSPRYLKTVRGQGYVLQL